MSIDIRTTMTAGAALGQVNTDGLAGVVSPTVSRIERVEQTSRYVELTFEDGRTVVVKPDAKVSVTISISDLGWSER